MPSVLNSLRKPNGRKDFQGFRYTGQDKPIPCAIFPIQYFGVKSGTYGNQRVRPPPRSGRRPRLCLNTLSPKGARI